MYLKKFLTFILSGSLCFTAAAQQKNTFPQHYFRNPLNIPIHLAGGFGEVRPNHFHTGIDIRTADRQNLPVHAAAAGYISRISISSRGYGNCLYVTHPNGYTTVYGHLNKFYPALEKWMISQQYQQKTWAIQLFPKPGQFPVKKGQVIAWSGETGGAVGPHLHFEIRNTKTEHVLNELLFGLPYKDTRAPSAESIAIYNGGRSIYMQNPEIIALQRIKTGFYRTQPTLINCPYPSIFMGIHAEDHMVTSRHWKGIYQMKLYLDDKLQVATQFNELRFNLARYANAYADYKTKKDKGIWYQGLYKLPNNKLHIYTHLNPENGKLDISDGKNHHIRISISDAYGNTSQIQFSVRYNGQNSVANAAICGNDTYWDWQSEHHFRDSVFAFYSPKAAFYDDLCLHYTEEAHPDKLTASVQLMNVDIPIQKWCHISLKLNHPIPKNLQSKIAFVHHVKSLALPGNNPQSGMAGNYKNGWVSAKIRTFGNYYAVIDTIPPKIISDQSSGKIYSQDQSIRFKATDSITAVASFNGYLNGAWLRFVRRGDTYTYHIDNHCPKGKNELAIEAVDENGNKQSYHLTFTRK